MKKKIFFVINTLQRGGAERVSCILANEFDKQGFEVFVICMNQAFPAYEISPRVKLVSLLDIRGKEHIFNRAKYAWLIFSRLVQLLIKERPACVVSFMTTANLYSGLACILTGVPFIISEHTTPHHTVNSFNYLKRKLTFIIYRQSKAIVVVSKGIADCIKKNKSFKKLDNFITLRNPVNVFQSLTKNQIHHRKFIIAVGRLTHVKGFDQLIDAFSNIDNDSVDLLIVGGGEEYENLDRQIKSLEISDRVILVGAKDNLQDYYSQAELLVLSSRNEGYPNVLIEAMSFGCPCIAMDCEFGPSEIITNKINGILVEQNNFRKLMLEIDYLLVNDRFRDKISANAKLINRTNSVENITSEWKNLIFS
ncbi:MAG: glycosyltransferase family 4 protein [Chryseobacterium sp.]|nr:MAG: glycosyltransferase family 4 protein [Chryseobacterium sp.]